MEITKSIKCGKTRRKLEDITLTAAFEITADNIYNVTFSSNGEITFSRSVQEFNLFDAIKIGYAGLRQLLSHYQNENPTIKFFEEIDGELIEQTIQDIFWTHDCVSDEMQDMINWAKDNGYKPS